jgi:hypothetical protein
MGQGQDAEISGRQEDVLLLLAQELHRVAVAARRPDVAAKADEVVSLLVEGTSASHGRKPTGGKDTTRGASDTAMRIMNGLGF